VRLLQLGNTANWQLLFSSSYEAIVFTTDEGAYVAAPIPDIEVPVILDKFILAVRITTSVPPKSDWNFAGKVKQKLFTGITIDGQDATRVKTQPLFLNQLNLVMFEKISASYSISIKVPKWFTNAVVSIWQYTGVDSDSVEVVTQP